MSKKSTTTTSPLFLSRATLQELKKRDGEEIYIVKKAKDPANLDSEAEFFGMKPKYKKGNRIPVKERWCRGKKEKFLYKADFEKNQLPYGRESSFTSWESAISMPEEAVRFKLSVKDISLSENIPRGIFLVTLADENPNGSWYWVIRAVVIKAKAKTKPAKKTTSKKAKNAVNAVTANEFADEFANNESKMIGIDESIAKSYSWVSDLVV